MSNPWAQWIAWQQKMVDLQKTQVEAATRSVEAASKGVATNQSAVDAQKALSQSIQANVRAWEEWMKMWGMK